MRIAVPTAYGKLCPHFGHCETFAIVDVDPEKKTILKISSLKFLSFLKEIAVSRTISLIFQSGIYKTI